MPDFFYDLGFNLGRMIARKRREARWIVCSLTGTEAEVIQAEFDVGRDLAREFAHRLDRKPEPLVEGLLADLGTRLTRHVQNREWRFNLYVLREPEINAFALPGGFVFVTPSLLQFCALDRDELAFVLSHEMGHIVRRHAMDRLIANTAIRAAVSGLAAVRGPARLFPVSLATTLFQQGYSQDQELEADRFGAELARAAGFDPRAATQFLERLASVSGDPSILSDYLSSHPPLAVRVQNLKRVLDG